jgi:hypothetical protein
MTPEQCRMSRTALGLGVQEFAGMADVSPFVIASFERGTRLHRRTVQHLSGALEALLGWETESDRSGQPQSAMSELFRSLWTLSDTSWFEPGEVQTAPFNALLDALHQFLDIVAQDEREPDVWERRALNGALNALSRGWLALAYVEIRNAITPPDNRSPHYSISAEGCLEVADLDSRYFRQCLRALAACGPRRNH